MSVSSSRRAASRWSAVHSVRTAVSDTVPSPWQSSRVTASSRRASRLASGPCGSGTGRAPVSPVGEPVVPAGHPVARREQLGRARPVGGGRRAAPQVEHGVAGQPQADDAGDQARHLGQRDRLRPALGQVAAERVVEPPRRRRGADRLGGRGGLGGAGVAAPSRTRPRREVGGAVGVGLRQRAAERGGGAARPEQEPDGEADRAADRDVLDPHQPDLASRPARGC